MEDLPLANHDSAMKRHRQSLKAKARNKAVKTRVKNAIKAVRLALTQNDPTAVEAALKTATSVLDKAAAKKVIHWKTAARKISRLSVAANKTARA